LPIGSIVYILFCTRRYGWGWDNFIKEANAGKGIKIPTSLRWYLTYVPLAIIPGGVRVWLCRKVHDVKTPKETALVPSPLLCQYNQEKI